MNRAEWTGRDLNWKSLPGSVPVVDRFPVPNFEHENSQETLLNVEDHPIVPDSKPVVGGVDEPLNRSMGILFEFSDLVEDPAGDRSIQLLQLASRRIGPDDLKDNQKSNSSLSC